MINVDFSEEEFNNKALEFFNVSKLLNDNWNINHKNDKYYLTKKQFISLKSEYSQSYEDDCSDPSAVQSNEIINIEYHVLFHPSYQVPVLYFNAYEDGKLISFHDIPKIFVNINELKTSQTELLNIVTQAEHPILFQPFFMLHPCKVQQVLSQFKESKNFVLTFISIFGPSVKLNLSLEYQNYFDDHPSTQT
ncbi:CLUMA_CG016158, isoform A [Clunio marinus]|uniref:Ubiquitin-like-conjugating enzyme ATG10 n=1 Tax=Clunio marinus TaxID=568069 RepID=A0A1J1IS58_9DIPT|nr:CLUMA_CG016158, isoform A [Clunio marinus]